MSKLKFNISLLIMLFFFVTTPLIISISLLTLLSYDKPVNSRSKQVLGSSVTETQIFAAPPDESPSTSIQLIASDARGEILKSYLHEYGSPLEKYSYFIVNTADEYGIDFRIITAIAQQESNLCKYIPENTFN